MKSLVELLDCLLQDCGRLCGAPVAKDIEVLKRRVEHEGDGFITISLAAFCSDFERSLDLGFVGPGCFTSFGKIRTGIPAFLQGFLSQVFDDQLVLLENPSIDCIRAIRQLCLFAKKVRRPCSPERERAAVAGYLRCETEVLEELPESALKKAFEQVAHVVMTQLPVCGSDRLDVLFEYGLLEPRHGPGTTEEKLLGNQKYIFRRWHKRLEDAGFSWWTYGRGQKSPVGSDGSTACGGVVPTSVEPGEERPVRVVFVPKTLKTPRVIAVEPACMQYAQQALKRLLVGDLEQSPLTQGRINFSDQQTNRELAKEGSKTRSYATIDLSEASDRVSLAHVVSAFKSVPFLLGKVLACRSTWARLPGGGTVHLRKFASMGSALCFPVEALVFWMNIVASRIVRVEQVVNTRTVQEYGRDVYVYGDDLCVPVDEASSICDDLTAMGFKVNTRKSFWTGKFRESCGSDMYSGECVTPTYLRRDMPADRGDGSGILSSVSTSNQLYSKGYWKTSAAIRKAVEALTGPLPQVSMRTSREIDEYAVALRNGRSVAPMGPAIGWNSNSEAVPLKRFCKIRQQTLYRCLTPAVTRAPDPLDGDGALVKCLQVNGTSRPADLDHLDQTPTRYSVTLKNTWVSSN